MYVKKNIFGILPHVTFPTNETKEKNKKYEELWHKIRYLIRSITKSSDDYDEK